jgi:hypothetical protein
MVAHVDVSPGGGPSWLRLARRAKLLAKLTLVWLGIEGTVGVVAGILAGSIAFSRLWPRQRHRGSCQRHRHLALHWNRFGCHVGREQEEADRHPFLRAALGAL